MVILVMVEGRRSRSVLDHISATFWELVVPLETATSMAAAMKSRMPRRCLGDISTFVEESAAPVGQAIRSAEWGEQAEVQRYVSLPNIKGAGAELVFKPFEPDLTHFYEVLWEIAPAGKVKVTPLPPFDALCPRGAVELIVAVIVLKKCELGIVQSSLIGSMLSNLLLVLGMCFFFGGLKFYEQAFEGFVTQVNSSLLMFALAAVLLPAVFHWQTTQNLNEAARNATQAATTNATQVSLDHIEATQAQILQFSRGIAIILLVVYIGYMGLSLFTHASIYSQETGASTPYAPKAQGVTIPRVAEPESIALEDANVDGSTVEGHAPTLVEEVEEDDPETPQLNGRTCFGLMILVTVGYSPSMQLVAITAEFLVGSIDGLTESGKISKEFVGMVLLPIVGNAAEHVSAVTVAVKDKMNLSIGVAVGSSIQIGLFVIPFSVLVAWGMEKPMTLLFDPFEVACLALAVVTVNYCVADGKSNWLEGTTLMTMLGTLFFCYTGVDVADHFATCT
ncbi:Sodium/calcium exchanger protein-domain-containing protein [Mycena olivaceomarginata]|nr:Sodium/calcium exchanger protein-domain-containing protein [Mycena olivaceomarginata]